MRNENTSDFDYTSIIDVNFPDHREDPNRIAMVDRFTHKPIMRNWEYEALRKRRLNSPLP